jgi:hypothetical protein
MMNYDPNSGLDFMQKIEPSEEEKKKGPPTGLIEVEELEKKVDESQMADFSTPIEEVMAGPGQLLQDEVMGPPIQAKRAQRKQSGEGQGTSSSNPLNLTDEQYTALIAGIVAVLAFSKPVQSRLEDLVPKFLESSGGLSMTGMAVTALVAAILFYFARRFLNQS